jgi:aspartyl-tRNA(Asn)/glutamyl-tRNA(Gln) amidotransferase subunit B
MEEDAGKSLHEDFHGMSGIDLNRAGTPLLEIVSEPDMRSSAEAVAYARALHALVPGSASATATCRKAASAVDANVSVRPVGQAEFGTRREIKNLNSFRFCSRRSTTRSAGRSKRWKTAAASSRPRCCSTPTRGETRMMRSKEDAHDYRYFPDPDLLPLKLDEDWIERVRARCPNCRSRCRRASRPSMACRPTMRPC